MLINVSSFSIDMTLGYIQCWKVERVRVYMY